VEPERAACRVSFLETNGENDGINGENIRHSWNGRLSDPQSLEESLEEEGEKLEEGELEEFMSIAMAGDEKVDLSKSEKQASR
jgi:hypothetical protein